MVYGPGTLDSFVLRALSNKFIDLNHWTPAFAGVTNGGCHCGMVLSRNPVSEKYVSEYF